MSDRLSMSTEVFELCSRIEKQMLLDLSSNRGIDARRVYTKKEFLSVLGIGDEAWRSLKAAGLKTCSAGSRVVVRGAEFERWVQENEK
jgi:hypothetical protein